MRLFVGCIASFADLRLFGFEIGPVLKISNQPAPGWAPSQPLLRSCAGGRTLQTAKVPENPKVPGWLFARLTDNRHTEATADYLGDISERHTAVGDRVIVRGFGRFLDHEPIETR